EPAIFRFDQRIYPVRIATRYRYPDASYNARGQPLPFQMLPRVPAVNRLVKPAARTAAAHTPRRTHTFPQRCKKNVGIMRIEHQVNRARLIVLEKNFLPRLTTIGGPEYSAIR